MASQLEVVTGLVEQVSRNGRGALVDGQWLNVSQFRPLAELPRPGQRVDVQVARGACGPWIDGLEILDGGLVHELPARARHGDRRPQSDPRDIRRLAVLKAAAAFAAGRPEMKSADVLVVADRWLASVEQHLVPER